MNVGHDSATPAVDDEFPICLRRWPEKTRRRRIFVRSTPNSVDFVRQLISGTFESFSCNARRKGNVGTTTAEYNITPPGRGRFVRARAFVIGPVGRRPIHVPSYSVWFPSGGGEELMASQCGERIVDVSLALRAWRRREKIVAGHTTTVQQSNDQRDDDHFRHRSHAR